MKEYNQNIFFIFLFLITLSSFTYGISWSRSSDLLIGATNHSQLNELNWSSAGHVMDTDLDMDGHDVTAGNFISSVGGLLFDKLESRWAFKYADGLGADNIGLYFNVATGDIELKYLGTTTSKFNVAFGDISSNRDIHAGRDIISTRNVEVGNSTNLNPIINFKGSGGSARIIYKSAPAENWFEIFTQVKLRETRGLDFEIHVLNPSYCTATGEKINLGGIWDGISGHTIGNEYRALFMKAEHAFTWYTGISSLDCKNPQTMYRMRLNSTALDVNATVMASNFSFKGEVGLSGNYSLGSCWQYFKGGILVSTNCTKL